MSEKIRTLKIRFIIKLITLHSISIKRVITQILNKEK